MGTDIHAVFQRRNGDRWEDIEHGYNEERDYFLFAWLAGVRNGSGFASVLTGEPLEPISQPRGLPADFDVIDGDRHPVSTIDHMPRWRLKYRDEDEPLTVWMGDHSHSWLTSDEMFKAPGQCAWSCGVISRDEYERWEIGTQPGHYCGDVWGRGLFTADVDRTITTKPALPARATHARVWWKKSIRVEFAPLFAELQRLHDAHGVIRMVFGFDS